ncbi:MAG: M28 family peptidase [Sphingomonadales bacterium]|nr:M28 family peptidase [Sphingomonadales bacterium]
MKYTYSLSSKLVLWIGLVAFSHRTSAQIQVDTLADRLRFHTYALSDDSMAGRQTGSVDEQKAARYIISAFREMKLKPAGDFSKPVTGDVHGSVAGGTADWKQAFTFTARKEFAARQSLRLGRNVPVWGTDWHTLPESGSGLVKAKLQDVSYGISAPDLGHDDYAGQQNLTGKIALIRLNSPDGNNPHGKFGPHSPPARKIRLAFEKGALAVVFYPGSDEDVLPTGKPDRRTQSADIPAVCLTREAYLRLKPATGMPVQLHTGVEAMQVIGHNVVAFLDNRAAHTVVVGAHYDHLGDGTWGGSLQRDGNEPAIHNGADDNASGTAGLIELARYFISTPNPAAKGFNYLFMAFSGEELGLLGSAYFARNPTYPLKQVAVMINLDMIGRLDSQSRSIGVYGVGTSPIWRIRVDSLAGDLKPKTHESGSGASDHTSFYLQDIPVLHLFTGTHTDYHKPSDDAGKINYQGMAEVVNYVVRLVESIPAGEKPAFVRTTDSDRSSAPSFKVTLGIMPDYFYEGRGVRIDGVTPNRPAGRAGMLRGDLLLEMGSYETADMDAYMKALGAFSKGQTITARIMRGDQILELPVTF